MKRTPANNSNKGSVLTMKPVDSKKGIESKARSPQISERGP